MAQLGGSAGGRASIALSPWLPAFAVSLATLAVSLVVLAVVTLDAFAPAQFRSIAIRPGTAPDQIAGQLEVVIPPVPPPLSGDRVPGSIELSTDPRLRAAIQGALGSEISHYGIVVRRLADGRGVAINAGESFYAASTFKLAVLYEVERRRSEGLIHDSDRIFVSEADAAEDLGTIGDVPIGPDGTVTIPDALRAMVTISDNATAVALLHFVGAANIDDSLAKLGIEHTSVNTTELPTTAADMALLMEAIVTGKGMSEASRLDMRELLLAQRTRTGIPAGLPPNIPVGNKTGTWEGATHDVAFVDAPGGTYVIAILSDKDWSWEPIARVSKAVYEVMTSP
jgi:beta-lactamase class A